MNELSPIALGFLGSLAAGSLTAVGAVPVLFGKVPSRSTRDMALGFAAGVMLAASFFSLIIPALDAAEPVSENGAMHAALTGPVEPVGGLPGAGIMMLSRPLLPWGLAFAAARCSTSSAVRSFPRRIAADIRTARRSAWRSASS